MTKLNNLYLPKDFIETAEGLCFAVVHQGLENCDGQDKVLCFLRYIKREGQIHNYWHKVNTETANEYLTRHYPKYLHHSSLLDADLHGVNREWIVHHHQPRQRLQAILLNPKIDEVERDLGDLCHLFQQNGLDIGQMGVTGSLLIAAQQAHSDLDVVFYDRENFNKARAVTADLIEKQKLRSLAEKDWLDAYERRSCALSLHDYVWHERRKFNKALINGRKFDLNLVVQPVDTKPVTYRKLGKIKVLCKITDDRHSFDYPAFYGIEHENISSVVCFIATYTGQAVAGETVEVSGLLELLDDGSRRIVVGSSREAPGEYIKVVA